MIKNRFYSRRRTSSSKIKGQGIILLLFLLSGWALGAQQRNTLETGSMLFLNPEESCRVLLDGTELGWTPLLIGDISPSSRQLVLFGTTGFHRTQISYKDDIQGLQFYSPELEGYFGYLELQFSQDFLDILVNGVPQTVSDGENLMLSPGTHVITLAASDFLSEEHLVEIPTFQKRVLEFALNRAYPLHLSQSLPENSKITIQNQETLVSEIFLRDESIQLENGQYSILIENDLMEDLESQFSVSNAPVVLELELEYYSPMVRLLGIEEGSVLMIDEQMISPIPEDGTIELTPGIHRIHVQKEDHQEILEVVSLTGNELVEIELDYQLVPEVQNAGLVNTGLALLGSGALIMGGGMVMNMDSLLFDMTSTYQDYSTMKYASLSVAGAGLSVAVTGLVMGALGIFGSNAQD